MEKKILVVDDEAEITEEISEALTDEGYEVTCALSYDQALEALRADAELKVVITDLMMPGKTGLELMKSAPLEVGRPLTFIVLSGTPGAPGSDDLSMAYIFRYLTKPVNLDVLIEAVEEACQHPLG